MTFSMSTDSNGGCVIFLLDESAGMGAIMRDMVSSGAPSNKTNAERVSTALNSLLSQLSAGPDCDVALVGYQADAAGQLSVGSRFGGSLAGRDFVRAGALAAAPLRVESRTRKISAPGGIGMAREETVSFPIWYSPSLGAKAPQIAAYNYCQDLVARWLDRGGSGVPVVVHVQSGSSGDGNPQMVIEKLFKTSTPAGPPVVLQVHLAASAQVMSSLYPSNPQYLTVGSSRDLFRRCSPLPEHWIMALKEAKTPVNKGARAMLYNAKIADVIRAFSMVKAHVRSLSPQTSDSPPVAIPASTAQASVAPTAAPAPAAPNGISPVMDDQTATAVAVAEPVLAREPGPASTGEKASLIVLVLDRSVEDPFSGDLQNSCAKLQDHGNEILKQISKISEGEVDAAIVSYGLDSSGQPDVRTTFEGPLAGRTTVPRAELSAGALKVDEFTEEVSNGIGGLVTLTRKKPIYFELEPTSAASPVEAFAAVARIVTDWTVQHPTACLPPIVLHMTRGAHDPSAMDRATGSLRAISAAAGPVVLYHLVATEAAHKSSAYPASAADIDEPTLQKLWDITSPLLDRARLASEKPAVMADSRGIVINGKFDLLLDGVKAALAG